MSDPRRDLVQAIADRLEDIHFHGNGCGTDPHNPAACSNCYGPSPMSAGEIAEEALNVITKGTAEAMVVPVELFDALLDPDPCEWDHNHSCQAHGYFYLDQGVKCPVQEARDLLDARRGKTR